jgi:hypothetical protein
MIGAKDRLAARLGRRFSMNAKVSRQADEFVDLVDRLRARGGSIDALIIQMGNNGPLYSDEMDALHQAVAGVGEVFLVNDLAPVSWSGESDEKLSEAARAWPHTTLIDWHSIVGDHLDRLTWDGLHLTPAGAGVYTRLITREVRSKVRWPKNHHGHQKLHRSETKASHKGVRRAIRSRHSGKAQTRGKGRDST